MKPCILIVDDEPNVRLTYRATLETEGFEVREASDCSRRAPRNGREKIRPRHSRYAHARG